MSVVSSVLSRVSTRSRPPIINASVSSFMDNLFSIAFGLGLRFVVDTVSRQDFKLTGTLVGLWEGVILLHFTKKTPKSSDPYIAFAVRLCVDFWLTESVARLVLVLIWTGLGMILADITPAIWSDVGLNRVWRRLRRDLYTIAHMVPTVAFFPPQRTVRFSPSHAPSVIGEEEDIDDAASDITATAHTPSAPPPPPNPILPASRDARKRRVPGHYGFEYSDTETERSFGVTPPRAAAGRTSRRQSLFPAQAAYDESLSSITPTEDVDAGNLSDGVSSSGGTERVGPSSTSIINMSEVQGMEDEAAALAAAMATVAAEAVAPPTIDTAVAAAVATKGGEPTTPTQQPLWIPPTPSDSAAAWRLSRAREAANLDAGPSSAITPVLPVPVRAALGLGLGEPLAQIPDFLDEPLTEDWTDLGKSVAPDPFTVAVTAPAPAPAATTEHPAAEDANTLLDPLAYDDGWPSASAAAGAEPREYKTAADFDDIYGDEVPLQPAAAPVAVEGEADAFAGETADLLGGESAEPAGAEATGGLYAATAWDDAAQADAEAEAAMAEEARKMAEEIAQLEQEEAAAAAAAEKEAEAQRLAEAAAAADALAKRLAEEEAAAAAEAAKKEKREKKKKDKEKKDADERKAKEEADEAARQQKRAEEEAKEKEEQERKEKAKNAKEQKRKDAEAAAERRAQKKREEDEEKAAAAAALAAKEEQEREERERAEREEAERQAKEEAERKEKEEQERERAEKEEAERKEKEEAERQEKERQEQEEREAAERQEREQAESAAAAAALDAALAQEQAEAEAAMDAWGMQPEQAAAPGHEEAAGEDLPVSTGFSPEPLVNFDDEAMAPSDPAPAPAAPAYEESVVSDASAMAPQDPRERVERMMILRAQMVEIQKQIDDLKAGGAGEDSVQLRQMEKVMRKMVRQATRRYAAGVECAQYLNGFDDTADVVTLENLHVSAVIKKVAEQMESLLSPSARSLHFSVQVAKKATDAKKQKPKVLEIIDEFNLTNYTTENPANKKISEIDIPEEAFATWLTEYRNLLAKRAQQEEEPEYSPWG